jgi:hypothetical protein
VPGLQPTVFYRWQKAFFENGSVAFEHQAERKEWQYQRRIEVLEAKFKCKDEVMAQLMEEHVALKKVSGKSE